VLHSAADNIAQNMNDDTKAVQDNIQQAKADTAFVIRDANNKQITLLQNVQSDVSKHTDALHSISPVIQAASRQQIALLESAHSEMVNNTALLSSIEPVIRSHESALSQVLEAINKSTLRLDEVIAQHETSSCPARNPVNEELVTLPATSPLSTDWLDNM
jgi:hypothetical protein